MSVTPCEKNTKLKELIRSYSETLKKEAHKLGEHGLDEKDLYNSGVFRGAIESIRGQFTATMKPKREFVRSVLNYVQAAGAIKSWNSSGAANRHDYTINLPNGRVCAIELKGCLDGNNTLIFERPPNAEEFVIWSVCINLGADPRHNVWSGISRLSTDIISREVRVDGLIVWDMVCGTAGRPCPKRIDGTPRRTEIDSFSLTPPCLYLFPATIPSPRNNPKPRPQRLAEVHIMKAFYDTFGGTDAEINTVTIEVENQGSDMVRTTTIARDGAIQQKSEPIPIRRK